ncbi:MAG: hypothetical protein KDK78_00955 [Chlamydiia bacterium]|nr:hypothetical protein [Chlamydiia bacterium]
MGNFRLLSLLFACISVTSSLSALACFDGHEFSLAPQGGYLRRVKASGSEQKAFVYGMGGYYQRWVPNGVFVRAEGYYLEGELEGENIRNAKVKSDYDEYWGAAALGWSCEVGSGRPITLAPYVMYGRFYSENKFTPPTALLVEMRNRHQVGGLGLQMRAPLTCSWNLGMDGRVFGMWDAKNKVVDDPTFGTFVQLVDERVHYYLAFPVSYSFCEEGIDVAFEMTPFYWFRSFGGRENVPVDYDTTRFRQMGLSAGFTLRL